MASATSFLVSWIEHSDPGTVNDVKCTHAYTALRKIHLVFAIAIVLPFKWTFLVSVVDDTSGDDCAELAEVLHDEGVGCVEVEARYCYHNFFFAGWADETSFNCFIDSNALTFAELIKIDTIDQPNMDASASLEVAFNILFSVYAQGFE